MALNKIFAFVLSFVLLLSLGSVFATAGRPSQETEPGNIVSLSVLEEIEQAPNGQARFLVYLKEKANLATARTLPDRGQRGEWVYSRLRQTAQRSQVDIIAYLDQQQESGHVIAYRSFWIFNGLAVTADHETLEALAARSEVERIVADRRLKLIDPSAPALAVGGGGPTPTPTPPGGLEWNIELINADDVWDELGVDGTGVVVANMDTGVFFTHPALMDKYRGTTGSGFDHNYNWYDATRQYPGAPADGDGHGTHTMGTIVGAEGEGLNQIGVAPGAQWIAVKVLDDWGYGYVSDVHAGFQWMLAPTDLNGQNPDPGRAPHVANNSWGSDDGWDTEFQQDVQAWLAAGIVPIFSAGNAGPWEGSIGMPASYPESWAVGATDSWDEVAYFSSRGPSPLTDETKPEFSAPGVGIRSSWNDGGYAYLDGTSMAAPHVAGLAALLLQADPTMTVESLEDAIASTALDLGVSGPDDDYGWGRIDAYAAVFPVNTAGILTGQVSGSGAEPIAGVILEAQSQTGGRIVEGTTDAQGVYTFTLPAGLYDVTARTYGYLPVTIAGIPVVTDETTHRDFTLSLAPRYQLSGQVTEADTGTPLAAAITVFDTPLSPVETNPTTGNYSLEVAQGSYEMKVTSAGHRFETRGITVAGNLIENFSLAPIPPILLVDDDGGEAYETYFAQALVALGEDYTYWEVNAQGEPPFSELEQYPIVIWSTADAYYDTLSQGVENSLAAYLDGGGQLFLSSRDYLLDRGVTSFAYDYLHIKDHGWDWSMDTVAGVAGNPIGAWLGPYALSSPSPYGSYGVCFYPDELASTAFTGSGYYGPECAVGVTYLDRQTCFRTVFFSFPFENLQASDAVVVMNRILRWFRGDCGFGALMGTVTDARTHEPVEKATISAYGPRDNLAIVTDEMGAYTITLLADVYAVNVSQSGYISETVVGVEVVDGTTITLDVSLDHQVLLSPSSLSVRSTVTQTVTRTFTISNNGSSTFEFEIKEIPEEFVPLMLDGGALENLNILVYADNDWMMPTQIPYVEQALQAMDLSYVAYSDCAAFEIALRTGGPWDLVIVSSESYGLLSSTMDALYNYVTTGQGRLIYGSWDAYMSYARHDLFIYCGVSLVGDYTFPLPVYWWTSHSLFSDLPQFTTMTDHYHRDGQYLNAVPGVSAALAGYSISPTTNQGAIVVRDDEMTIVNGFNLDENHENLDADSFYDGVELYMNEISFLLYEEPDVQDFDIPWLSEEPVTGTVPAYSAVSVDAIFDAAQAQPGTHSARLVVGSQDRMTAVVDPSVFITLTVEPATTMGRLAGAVADQRTGEPLEATVAAADGRSVVADETTGQYVFWLEEGNQQLEISAEGYLSTTTEITITAQTAITRDFVLRRDGSHLTLVPSSLVVTATCGQTITQSLTISNSGTQPLAFQFYETTADDDLAARIARSKRNAVQSLAWPRKAARASLTRSVVASRASTASLDTFIFDPTGDAARADIIRGAAAIEDMGWDGEPPALSLRLTFDDGTFPRNVVGYVHLDTDRNASTGRLPQELAGMPEQDIGLDYYLDLFGMPNLGLVDVWRQDGTYMGSVVGTYVGQSLEMSIPLSLLGYDDGVMDVTVALGTTQGAEEWTPEVGHSTIGVGAGWLTESDDDGSILAGEERAITLTLDVSLLQPGDHTARLAVSSNDPVAPLLYMPLTLTVEPGPTMGKLTGEVTSKYTGRGVRAKIFTQDGPFASTDPVTGQYTFWLEEGTRLVRAVVRSSLLISQTVTVSISAQETLVQDFSLEWCGLYLPFIFRSAD